MPSNYTDKDIILGTKGSADVTNTSKLKASQISENQTEISVIVTLSSSQGWAGR